MRKISHPFSSKARSTLNPPPRRPRLAQPSTRHLGTQDSLNPQPATSAPAQPSTQPPPHFRDLSYFSNAVPGKTPTNHGNSSLVPSKRISVICRDSNRKEPCLSVICRTFETQHQAKPLQITDSHTSYVQSIVAKPYKSRNSRTYADGNGRGCSS